MQNISRQWQVVILAAIAALAVILTNCQSSPPSSQNTSSESNPPGLLIYGSSGQPVNLEPGNVVEGNSLIVHNQIYNRLLDFKPGTTDLAPSLATSWLVSGDGKSWTFQLRSGVKFHDGTDFDAEAVKFNVERWWNPQHPYGYRNAGKTYEIWPQMFGGFKDSPKSLLKDVVVTNKYAIKFVLNQPFAAFPAAIGSSYFSIASPTAIKQAGANYGKPGSLAVGTGAFIFKEWRTGDRILLTKNPHYWQQGLPKVDQLAIRFITDPAARLAQLRAKQIDFTVDLAPDQLKEIEKDSQIKAIPRPSFNVGYLALNPSYQPLSNIKVRQAIALAINKQAIVQAFWGNLGQSDCIFTPPILAISSPTTCEYNPTQAKELLAEAGYPKGFDLELWYMPVSRPYFPTPKPIAEALAAELSTIGVRVKLQTKDWASYLSDRLKPPGFQSFMMGWTGDYGDPDNFYYPHFGPGATADLGGWQNPKVLQLLDAARANGNLAARTKIYTEISEILQQEAVRLPIVHAQPLLVHREQISGWIPSPLGSESFENISKK